MNDQYGNQTTLIVGSRACIDWPANYTLETENIVVD